MRSFISCLLCGSLLVLGCGKKENVPEGRDVAANPPGAETSDPHAGTDPHAGMGMGTDASAPTDGNAVPLKLTGVGSALEMKRELSLLTDARELRDFERAFRLTFTTDHNQRDYATARDLLQSLITSHPEFPGAYRTLGYAEFSINPADTAEPLRNYDRAVDLDPKYGEAHYAIAFMHAATGNREEGLKHYRQAMELGVADERNIGERFYGDMLKKTP